MTPTTINRRRVLAMMSAGAGFVGAAGLTACTTRTPSRRQSDLALAPEIDAAIERAMALDLSPALGVAVYSREGVYARGSVSLMSIHASALPPERRFSSPRPPSP